jgi:hypothetical protein
MEPVNELPNILTKLMDLHSMDAELELKYLNEGKIQESLLMQSYRNGLKDAISIVMGYVKQ